MVSLKIECPCGQHYAFEVEPVMGRMPAPVACPACGAEGTRAANEMIAQALAVSPGTAGAFSGSGIGPEDETSGKTISVCDRGEEARTLPPTPIAIAHAPAPRAPASSRSSFLAAAQPSKTQILFEARAKISWGDPPQEVLKYLVIQGLPYEEASAAVQEMFAERTRAIRQRAVVYIAGGIGMIGVPIATWIGFLHAGVIYPRFLIVTIAVGLGGIGVLVKGIFMFVTPGSSPGDVAEQ